MPVAVNIGLVLPYSAKRCFLGKILMQDSDKPVPRKDERLSVPFDKEVLDRIKSLAEQEERPAAKQVALLVKAALELMDEQGYQLIGGKLRQLPLPLEGEPRSQSESS